jgi:hypothetical protein
VILSVSSSRLPLSFSHLYSLTCRPPCPENHRGSTSPLHPSSPRTPCT